MFKLNTFVVLFLIVGLAVFPVKAEDELPVEIDMQLMSETMTMEQAQSRLQGDIKKYRLKKKEANKAQEALGKLVKEGISVNRACEEVCEAVRTRKRIEEVAEEGNIKRIKTQLAKDDIETQLRKRTEKDIETAVEVIEELIEKGVAVEKARNAVNKTIKEGGDRVQLREMLESDAVREMKQETIRERTRTNEDVEAERTQTENMGESKGPDDSGSQESDSGNKKRKH
ncbi:hypothetical protein ACFLUV_00420 [Elusimicrobiota bacterium]